MSVIKEVPYRGLDPVSNTIILAVMNENNNIIITIFGSNGEYSSIRMTEKMKYTLSEGLGANGLSMLCSQNCR